MNGLIKYRSMQLLYCGRRIAYKLGKKEYLPNTSLSIDVYNKWLFDRLIDGKPLMVARFGSQEARATAWSLGVDRGYDRVIPRYVQKRMAMGPGLFPSNDESVRRFGDIMVESAGSLDSLAYWDSFMQEYLLEEICPYGVITTYLENLEPYRYQAAPWSRALEGKTVLVVHPFASTIEKQYARRGELFANPDVLPDFELKTIIPPQTIAGTVDGRFENWFEALDFLKNTIATEAFDVCIIGCGAYGFPLAAFVKAIGKQAIHLGGATQMLFGIKGKRWDLKEISKELYNQSWTRPSETRSQLGLLKLRAVVTGDQRFDQVW